MELYKILIEMSKLAVRSHYYCEDEYYACPQAESQLRDGKVGSWVGKGNECDCGAEEHNSEVQKLLSEAVNGQ